MKKSADFKKSNTNLRIDHVNLRVVSFYSVFISDIWNFFIDSE